MKDFYAHARVALKYGILDLGCKSGDSILVPSFICEAALTPFREIKVDIIFYPTKVDLSPSWPEIEDIIKKKKCFAILMVHYFGIPQNISEFTKFCKKNNIFLIEDNAHGFGGFLEDKVLGTFGDIGIASPRKILNIPSGAILYKKNIICEPKLNKRKPIFFGEPSLRRFLSFFPKIKILFYKLFRPISDIFDPFLSEEKEVNEFISDEYSRRVLNNSLNAESMFEIRKKQQERWYKCLSLMDSLEIEALRRDIGPKISPWLFPVICHSIEERKKILIKSLKYGLIISSWPTLPSEVIQRKLDGYHKWFGLLFVHLNNKI